MGSSAESVVEEKWRTVYTVQNSYYREKEKGVYSKVLERLESRRESGSQRSWRHPFAIKEVELQW